MFAESSGQIGLTHPLSFKLKNQIVDYILNCLLAPLVKTKAATPMRLDKITKIINLPMDFSRLTAGIFLFHALVFLAGYLILGASPFISGLSVFLVIVLDLVFCFALVTSSERTAAHILVLAWFLIIFSLVRLAALLLLPPSTLEFLTPDGLTGAEISQGMVLYVGGSIALLFGIYAADRLLPQRRVPSNFGMRVFSLWSITGYWLVTYLVAYYVRVYLGVTIFGSPEHWGNRMAWVGIIFDTDIALLVTICWLAIKWRAKSLTKSQMVHAGLLIFLWLVFSIVIGSRGGPLRILIFLFFAGLAVDPRFKFSVLRLTVLIASFFVLNSAVYAMGTIFRHYRIGDISFMQAVDDYKLSYLNPKLANWANLGAMSDLRKKYYESEVVNEIGKKLRPTVTRLSLIDYSFTVFSKTPNEEVLDSYIRSSHALKNFANNLVPGEIFDEAIVNTSRVFPMAYRGRSLDEINKGYMSEPWTIWGMAWILGKYWGVVILFGVAFGIQALLSVVSARSRDYAVYVKCVYFITVISNGYMMFGVDHELSFVAHFSVSCLVACGLMALFDFVGKKIRPTKIPASTVEDIHPQVTRS